MQLLIYKRFVLDVCPTVTVIDVSLTHREESQLTETKTRTHTHQHTHVCSCGTYKYSVTVLQVSVLYMSVYSSDNVFTFPPHIYKTGSLI